MGMLVLLCDEFTNGQPAVAGGRMYLRTYGKLFCVGGAGPEGDAGPGARAGTAAGK